MKQYKYLKAWRDEAKSNGRRDEVEILERKMSTIEKAVNSLEDDTDVQRIMYYRFIIGMDLKEISNEVSYTISTISKKITKGIKLINSNK